MKRLIEAMVRLMQGLSGAISRFPLTVACLICAASLICYMISLHHQPGLMIQKLMFTFLLGSFLGIAAQFACERFARLGKLRRAVYILALLLMAGYYFILAPAPDISFEVRIRTVVAVFAMLCVFVWVPSYRGKFDFNQIALIHFKAAFISVLYSGVLSAGCASIIAAIDILLFNVGNDTYGYIMTIIWVLFATIYYLSLLPRFNSDNETDRELAEHAGQYPKSLEILISYIAIPLVAVYTLVLAAYFIKILVTLHWPSGQLGIMVLAYSAAGLTIFILSSLLENRFAYWYRLIFPKVLIPVVIMQLIAVVIRLNAYGVTESRYYVVIFGAFSIICGVLLSFRPVSKNGIIAVLAACIAIISVIPPVDAFTVSRVSQINRLEHMLLSEGILRDGKIYPQADVPKNVKIESTSIFNYLESRKYIKYIEWLPHDFKPYDDMKRTLGFEPYYPWNEANNFHAGIDMQKPFSIKDYDIALNTFLNSSMDKAGQPSYDFEVDGVKYQLDFKPVSSQEWYVAVKNAEGAEVVGTGLNDFVKSITANGNRPKESIAPEKMTFDVEKNGYKLRIIFQNFSIYDAGGADRNAEYNILVLFGAP